MTNAEILSLGMQEVRKANPNEWNFKTLNHLLYAWLKHNHADRLQQAEAAAKQCKFQLQRSGNKWFNTAYYNDKQLGDPYPAKNWDKKTLVIALLWEI